MGEAMKHLKHSFQKFLSDESGQTTTEYILILAIAVMIAVRFKGQLEGIITKATGGLDSNIDRALGEISE